MDEMFVDMTPTGPETSSESAENREVGEKKSPYTLLVSTTDGV